MKVFYTDGSCSINPGTGAYAAIEITDKKIVLVFCKSISYTTNNQMELRAVLMVILKFKNCKKTIYTDSDYIVKSFNSWIYRWKNKNFEKIKYPHIWSLIYKYKDFTDVKWVKAHDKNIYNNLVDKIVQIFCKNPGLVK